MARQVVLTDQIFQFQLVCQCLVIVNSSIERYKDQLNRSCQSIFLRRRSFCPSRRCNSLPSGTGPLGGLGAMGESEGKCECHARAYIP